MADTHSSRARGTARPKGARAPDGQVVVDRAEVLALAEVVGGTAVSLACASLDVPEACPLLARAALDLQALVNGGRGIEGAPAGPVPYRMCAR